MNFLKSLLPFLLITVIFTSCSDDPETETPVTPSNLTVNSSVSDDGRGTVTVTASADNALSYSFDFGEETKTSSSGSSVYTYSTSGDYSITVKAIGKGGGEVSKTISVSVTITPVTLDVPSSGFTTPESYANMDLIWQDEFNDTELNLTDWTHEIGTGSNGWGNNELQYYKKENTFLQDGYLVIEAKEEDTENSNYSSSRIITQGKQSFKYGRVDIRAALPKGQGIWPALWMLGSNFSTVGWPKCGEIDIMEMIGGKDTNGNDREKTVLGTVHWDANGSNALYGGEKTLDAFLGDEFHVFSIIWTASKITWYIDDVEYHVIDTTPADLSEFREEFFFIFNVAVGGNLPGAPNASTTFPQRMIVDYVRVFQDS